MGDLGLGGGGTQAQQQQTQAGELGTKIPEIDPVAATEGTPMWRVAGRRFRVPGTIIYVSKINKEKVTESAGSGKNAAEIVTYRYSVNIAVAFGQAFGGVNGKGEMSQLRILSANSKNIWFANNPAANADRYTSISIHLGGSSELPDSVLEGIKGVGKVPGFRDTTYVMIEEFQLEDFGNAVPQQWEALAEPDSHSPGSEYHVRDAIRDAWLLAPDRSVFDIVTENVTGSNTVRDTDDNKITTDGQFEGIGIEGLAAPAEIINAIMYGYDLGAREFAGQLHFYDRGDEPVIQIRDEHIGAYSGSRGDVNRPIRVRRYDDRKRPSEIVVNYYSQNTGYRRDSQRHRLNSISFSGENIVTVDLPICLPRKAAKRIARRRIYEYHREAGYCELIRLPWHYRNVLVGHYIAVPYEGRRLYIRVQRKTTGNNYLIEIEGPIVEERDIEDDILTSIPITYLGDADDVEDEDQDDLDDDSDPDAEDGDEDDYVPPYLEFDGFNVPAMTDEEAEMTGFFYGHAAQDPAAPFKNAKLYWSSTSGGTPKLVDSGKYDHEMVIGRAITTLSDSSVAGGRGIDTENTVQIQLIEGSIASVTTDQLFQGQNQFVIGDEIIAARDATALAPITTTVTGFFSSTNTLTRSSGSWVTDQFAVNQYVRVEGFDDFENRRFSRITALTSTVMTLDGPATSIEGPTSGIVVTAHESGAYELSWLVRGLRDTKDHSASHAAGERVALYDEQAISWVPIKGGKVGKTKYLKSVPKGLVPADIDEVPVTIAGETARPFRPVHLHFKRPMPGDEDLEIRWVHSTRLPDYGPTATQLHPFLEDKEKYRIELSLFVGMSPVFKTVTVKFDDHDDNRVCAWSYSAAEQVTDGIPAGTQMYCRIRQVGTKVKEGNWSDVLTLDSTLIKQPETGGLAALTATEGT